MQYAHHFLFRAMRPDDLEAVLAVQAACYPPTMQESAVVVLARMEAAGETCLVAQDEDGVCGYLFGYRSRLGMVTPLGAEFAPSGDGDTLYLHDLSVAPRAHGRGLARGLVGNLIARAQEQGLVWSALVSVQDTAGFWKALGYTPRDPADGAARAALASYPGTARYMVCALGPSALSGPAY